MFIYDIMYVVQPVELNETCFYSVTRFACKLLDDVLMNSRINVDVWTTDY